MSGHYHSQRTVNHTSQLSENDARSHSHSLNVSSGLHLIYFAYPSYSQNSLEYNTPGQYIHNPTPRPHYANDYAEVLNPSELFVPAS